MKKRDVHRIIKDSTQSFAPNISSKINSARVGAAPPYQRAKIAKQAPRFALASALLIVIIASSLFTGFMLSEAERVYVEINPSVELVLNHFGLVKEANALNAEAGLLLQGYNPKGKKGDKVVAYFVTQAEKAGYLDSNEATIYIGAYNKKGQVKEKNMARYREAARVALKQRNRGNEMVGGNISREEKQEANEANIPFGKYMIIKQIIQLEPSYTIEDLQEKSMSELKAILQSLQDRDN